MINFKKYLAMNEVNNININDLVDSIIRCTHNRITLTADAYQELVAKASNQYCEVNKKTMELMKKDLETINQLKQEVEYWKNLYESLYEENRKQTKKSRWFN